MKIYRSSYIYMALIAWLLSTNSFAAAESDTNTAENNKVTIQLKWFHQFQFAGYYAAIEKGFYAEEGLEVELLQRVPTSNHINNVLRGDAQYGVANAGLLLEYMRGKPVVLLAQIFQHSSLVFLSREDSGIRAPEDLAGKRITLNVEGYRHMPLIALLQGTPGGLDAARIEPFSFTYHEFIDGKTDVVPAYITDQPYRFREHDVAVNIINPQDYGIDFYGDNLFTTEQELSEHPERAEKIRRASLKGWRYALDNPEEVIDLILEKYNPQGLSRDHLAYEARETKNLIIPDFVEIGSFNPTRYQKTADIYASSGFVEQMTLEPGFFYSPKTLPKQIGLTAEEKAWLAANHTVRARVSDYPPYMFSKPVPSGMSVDYLNAIAKRIGIKIEFVPDTLGWPVSFQDVKDERQHYDLLLSMGRTPEREQQFALTEAYLGAPWVIYARQDSPYIINLESLAGKTLAAEKGYLITERLRSEYPAIQILEVATSSDALATVATGEADAYVGNLSNATYLIKQQQLNNLLVAAPTPFGTTALSMAIRKDWSVLAGLIDKGLAAMTPEERNTISQKWGAVELKPHVDYTLVWQVIIAAVLLLLAFYYWNRKLHREVLRREKSEEELKLAKEAAEAANQAKSVFLANMSHELRTPMQGILGFSERALEKVEKAPREKLKFYISNIHSSGQRLMMLLDGLLDLTKLQSGRMSYDIKENDLQKAVEMAVDEFSELMKFKGLSLKVEQPSFSAIAKFDENKILQILRNLLSNAIKFSSDNKQIDISFDQVAILSSKNSDETVPGISLTVSDQGVGIPENELESIFEKFVQSSKTLVEGSGTGLGLAISREIIEVHSGKITVCNNADQGVAFTLTIPC